MKIELLVDDAQLPTVVAVLRDAARTGRIGDGKIFVLPVDEVVRIRTGESGRDAI